VTGLIDHSEDFPERTSERSFRRQDPLDTPVQYVKGVGPRRGAFLARLGVETVRDLLFLIPSRYLDRTRLSHIQELVPGQDVSVWGRVLAAGIVPTRNRGELVSVDVQDRSGRIRAVWFNRKDLRAKFRAGQEIILSGRVSDYRGTCLVNPQFQLVDPTDEEFEFSGAVIPIYPLTEGLDLWVLRRLVQTALEKYLEFVPETLGQALLDKYQYPRIRAALSALHSPEAVEAANRARARLVFEEFLYFELVMALRRQQVAHLKKGFALPESGLLTGRFKALLPFDLTSAQQRVLDEIRKDMAAPSCMNRLLQGDVGSGKTVLAIYAMLIAVENGFQAAMMAPTEILAEQHYRNWSERLAGLGVRNALLTGSLKAKAKREVAGTISAGECDIVFGTHALIEADVRFSRLGLAVVDEQHRFGVMQRAALLNKGLNPDFLVMTATPIPRTITLTLYGDLDSSVLNEKPPGRQRIQTHLRTEAKRSAIYGFLKQKIAEGQQVFVVCPLVEESEKLDIAAATKTYEQMRDAFPGITVGLVHGRIKTEERLRIMEEFRANRISILVSTTVIEVGVDIPNATVMVIEHPERFGLAQLHQLRGRVGRGAEVAHCILIMPFIQAPDIVARLRFFEHTDDGFALAEKDLEIRGPGEILGTRQHGLPDLKLGDLQADRALLFKARDEAFALIAADPELRAPQNRIYKDTLARRYKGRDELLRVG
jgi:ATP-dependent DNA helicase RecG